eukprot:9496641-Pyramimonas_sp.AAC.1
MMCAECRRPFWPSTPGLAPLAASHRAHHCARRRSTSSALPLVQGFTTRDPVFRVYTPSLATSGTLETLTVETGNSELFVQVLASRGEESVAVVCHWGVVNALCGTSPDNCEVVECSRNVDSGHLQVLRHHSPPVAPRSFASKKSR